MAIYLNAHVCLYCTHFVTKFVKIYGFWKAHQSDIIPKAHLSNMVQIFCDSDDSIFQMFSSLSNRVPLESRIDLMIAKHKF